jgi:hypothetical protein
MGCVPKLLPKASSSGITFALDASHPSSCPLCGCCHALARRSCKPNASHVYLSQLMVCTRLMPRLEGNPVVCYPLAMALYIAKCVQLSYSLSFSILTLRPPVKRTKLTRRSWSPSNDPPICHGATSLPPRLFLPALPAVHILFTRGASPIFFQTSHPAHMILYFCSNAYTSPRAQDSSIAPRP